MLRCLSGGASKSVAIAGSPGASRVGCMRPLAEIVATFDLTWATNAGFEPAGLAFANSVDAFMCNARIAGSMALDTEPPAGCEVLVLEDDSILRRRLAAHLRNLGAEVTEVSTIGMARSALSGSRFDFALVDLHLPDGEVLDLLR